MRAGIVLLAASGCGFHVAAATEEPQPVDAPLDAPGPWSAPTPIQLDLIGVDDPTLTGDLLELFFNAGGDVYVTKRARVGDPWGPSAVVAAASGPSAETTPEISRDGLTLMFASDRAGTQGATDLWVTTRASRSAPWTTAIVMPEISTPTSEAGPVMTPDGTTITFTSFRKANIGPDVYLADRSPANGPWGALVEVTAVNTDGHEGSAFLSDDARVLIFDTDRTGNLELYTSERPSPDVPFPAPQPLVEINSPMNDEDPWLSPDGRRIVFYSNRGGTGQLWEASR